MSEKLCNILVYARLWCVYHVSKTVQSMYGSIVVLSALTHCALLHFICDLKTTQMNVQHIPIWILMLWKQPKTFVVRKEMVQLITVLEPDCSKNFPWVARILMIRQDLLSLRPWIPSYRGKSGK